MTKDLKISRGVTPRGCGLTFTFEQTHIAKGRSLKKKPDLSLPVCAAVPFLLSNHFWVNHRGIMKTYHPKHVFKCDWFSSLISWFLEKKVYWIQVKIQHKKICSDFIFEYKSAYETKYWNNILSYFTIHTQYRHTHLHQIWEKLSKYKQALIGIFNHRHTLVNTFEKAFKIFWSSCLLNC